MTMPSSILGRFIQQASAVRAATQEAFRWFSRAADQGHAHAMLIVAGLYASGRGITKDNVKAYSWAYIVASASKVDEDRNGARQLMSLLMKKMTSDEIGRAVVAARAWRAVRVAGAGKAPSIERAVEQDQPAPAAPPPAPAVVQPAPAAQPAPAVSQPAPSNVTILPASPKATPAPSSEECKERRCPRSARPGSVGPAQAIWLLI